MLAMHSNCSKTQQQSCSDSLHPMLIKLSWVCRFLDKCMQACSQSSVVPIPDSGTSIQQGFDSDVLVSMAVCICRLMLHLNLMRGSASRVVTCLDFQSDTCINFVTIILIGRLESFTLHVAHKCWSLWWQVMAPYSMAVYIYTSIVRSTYVWYESK